MIFSKVASSVITGISGSVVNTMGGGETILPSKTFDFMSETLDPDLTFSRSGAAWAKNSSGQWVSFATNTRRVHYVTPTYSVILLEPTTTNRMTDYNANPTTTSGWTKGGDALSVFSVVTDPSSLLVSAGIDLICTTGKIYKLDNSLGATTAYVDSSGTFGSTSKSTVSAWISGGTGSLTRTGAGTPETLAFTSSSPLIRRALSTTPNATSDGFRIVANAGQIIYFILAQIEVNASTQPVDNGAAFTDEACPTSPIVTTGATATRNFDAFSVTGLDLKSWWDEQSFTVSLEFTLFGFGASQHLFNINAGSSSNQYAIENISNSGANQGYMRPRVTGGGVADAGQDFLILGKPYIGEPNRVAFSSSATTYVTASPDLISDDFDKTFTARPTAPTTLKVGCNAAGSSNQMFGGIRTMKIYNVAKTAEQMGNDILPSDAVIYMRILQSLAQGISYSYTDGTQPVHHNYGALKARQEMKAVYPTRECIIMNGSIGATGLLYDQYGAGFGYVFDDGGVAGNFVDYGNVGDKIIKVCGQISVSGANTVIVAAQGGQGGLGTLGVTQARHEAAIITLRDRMVTAMGGVDFPLILEPIAANPVDQSTQELRQSYQSLNDNVLQPKIKMGPEIVDQPILASDSTHLTLAGNYMVGKRTVRAGLQELGNTITGGVYGATIASATYIANVITVTLDHEDGTDFTPSTGIKGLWVFDDTTMVFDGDTDSAVKTSSDTLTITLAGTPTGVVTLYSIYGTCVVSDKTLFTRDDTPNNLVLRSGVYTVTPETRISLQQAGIANVVAEWDATLPTSYPGSGTTWYNIATTPADGSTQSAYDLTLSGLTFTGTANSPLAYFLSAGLGSAVIGSNTPFLRDLHKTTGGSNYGMILFFETPTTPSTSPILSTHTTSSQNGIEIALDTGVRHRQGNGSSSVSDTGGTIAVNTLTALCIGHNHAGNQSYRAINTRTGTSTSHTFNTTTTDANQPLTLFGRTPSVALMPTGSKLKSAVLLNTYPTNAIVSAILDVKNVVHSNTYA